MWHSAIFFEEVHCCTPTGRFRKVRREEFVHRSVSSHNWLVSLYGEAEMYEEKHGTRWRGNISSGNKGEFSRSRWSPQCAPAVFTPATFPSVAGRNITVSPRAVEWYRRVIYRFACFIATRTRPYSGCTWLRGYLGRVRCDPGIYRTHHGNSHGILLKLKAKQNASMPGYSTHE